MVPVKRGAVLMTDRRDNIPDPTSSMFPTKLWKEGKMYFAYYNINIKKPVTFYRFNPTEDFIEEWYDSAWRRYADCHAGNYEESWVFLSVVYLFIRHFPKEDFLIEALEYEEAQY